MPRERTRRRGGSLRLGEAISPTHLGLLGGRAKEREEKGDSKRVTLSWAEQVVRGHAKTPTEMFWKLALPQPLFKKS